MRRFLLFLAILIPSAATAADPNENFFGYWTWHAPGLAQRTSPRDACIDLVAQLNAQGTPASYRGTSATGDPSGRDYTCLWKHTDAPYANDQSINALISSYICPSNATAISLNNSGLAVDFRCRCDSGTCLSPSPPAIDQTARCRKGVHTGGMPTEAMIAATSKNNFELAQSADPAFFAEYGVIASELEATEECTFARSDLHPGGRNNVNIGFLCGFRDGDEAAANNIAGFVSTPSGYVWHHDLTMGRMRLVTQEAHRACGSHIGGVAAWKEALGIIDYPFHLPPLN